MRYFIKQFTVGAIVLVGLLLFAILTLITGNNRGNLFTPSNTYKSIYKSIDGVYVGSEVTLHGTRTGNVINMNLLKNGNISVIFTIKKSHVFMINKSSVSTLKNKGMLGDRYINILTRDLTAPAIPKQSVIPVETTPDIASVIARSAKYVESLGDMINKFSTNVKGDGAKLSSILKSLDSILKKVDRGKGSLGAVINNRNLYNRMLILMGEKPRNNYLKDLSKKSKR